MIRVYSNINCSKCEEAKKRLRLNGFNYEEIKLNERPEARNLLRKKGFLQLPIFEDKTGFYSIDSDYIKKVYLG